MLARELNSKLKHLTLTATDDTTNCDHQCSNTCADDGCNCECGEWHSPSKSKMEFIGTMAQWNQADKEAKRSTYEERSVGDWDISRDGLMNIA